MKMIGPKAIFMHISLITMFLRARVWEHWNPSMKAQKLPSGISATNQEFSQNTNFATLQFSMWLRVPFAFDFAKKKNPFWTIRYRNPCKHLNVSRVSILIFMTHSAMLFSSLLHCSRCFIQLPILLNLTDWKKRQQQQITRTKNHFEIKNEYCINQRWAFRMKKKCDMSELERAKVAYRIERIKRTYTYK